jgi:hypothetical protein
MYVCICMCIYMYYVCMCGCMHACMNVCMYVYICMYVVCVYVCMYYACMCMYVLRMHMCKIRMYVCVFELIYMYIFICMYVCSAPIHSHTQHPPTCVPSVTDTTSHPTKGAEIDVAIETEGKWLSAQGPQISSNTVKAAYSYCQSVRIETHTVFCNANQLSSDVCAFCRRKHQQATTFVLLASEKPIKWHVIRRALMKHVGCCAQGLLTLWRF